MTATTLTKPDPPTPTIDDGLHHYTCCRPDTAMCGHDVTDLEWAHPNTNPDTPPCPICAHILYEELPCTIPRCPGGTP
jgi:hypothetical protein